MPEPQLPLALLASLLFTLMGPIALLPAFSAATDGATPALRSRIALVAFMSALVTLGFAVFAGANAMSAAGTSQASLIIAAGVILTLTALRNIFGDIPNGKSGGADAPRLSLGTGLMPVAIPGIVTPTGVAVLIIFVSYFPSIGQKLAILGAVVAIMVANLLAMLSAHWFMRKIGPAPLLVLGAVFGVLQAAMGVEMVISGITRSRLMQ
jgi:multiple antibiotic resistance protein